MSEPLLPHEPTHASESADDAVTDTSVHTWIEVRGSGPMSRRRFIGLSVMAAGLAACDDVDRITGIARPPPRLLNPSLGTLSSSVALRDFSTFTSGTTGRTIRPIDIPVPDQAVAGDLLLTVIQTAGNNVRIRRPSGWTQVDTRTNGSAVRIGIYRRIHSGAEPASYRFRLTEPRYVVAGMLALHGHNAAAPIHTFGWQTGAGTTLTAPSVSSSEPDALLLYIVVIRYPVPNTVAPPSGMTEVYDLVAGTTVDGRGGMVAIEPLAQAGATGTRSGVASAAGSYLAYSLVIQPAASTSTDRVGTDSAVAVDSAVVQGAATSLTGQDAGTVTDIATLTVVGPAPTVPFVAALTKYANAVVRQSFTIRIPADARPGDLLLVNFTYGGGQNPSVTVPAGWTQVRADVIPDVAANRTYWRIFTGTEDPTPKWVLSHEKNLAGGMLAVRGSNGQIEAHAGTSLSTTGTDLPAPGVTTSRPGCLLVFFGGLQHDPAPSAESVNATLFTPDSRMTELWDVNSDHRCGTCAIETLSDAGSTGGRTGTVVKTGPRHALLVAVAPAG